MPRATAGRSAAHRLLWRSPPARWLVAGHALGSLGDQWFSVGIPLLVQSLTPGAYGVIAGLQFLGRLPLFLLGVPGGALADRSDRRRVLAGGRAALALLVLGVPLAARTGGAAATGLLAAVALAWGSAVALNLPALYAEAPHLVPPEARHPLNGLLDAAKRLAGVVGAGLVPLIVARVSPPGLFVAQAAAFAAAAAAFQVAGRRRDPHPYGAPIPVVGQTGWGRIRAAGTGGAGALRRAPALGIAVLAYTLGDFGWGAVFYAPLVALAYDAFQGGGAAYAYLVAAYGAGGVAGNVLVWALPLRDRAAGVLWGWAATGVGFAATALAPDLRAALVLIFLTGLVAPVRAVSLPSLVQEAVPEGARGSVMGLWQALDWLGVSAGVALSGVLAGAVSPRAAVLLPAGWMALTAGLLLIVLGRVSAPRGPAASRAGLSS